MDESIKLDRDSWSTPQWLFNWLDSIYKFDVDLCASKENAKCNTFFDEKQNSLSVYWGINGLKMGFCNPPYSDTAPWIGNAIDEAYGGFTTVMIIPTPNGELHYEDVFKFATSITFITGRISFIAPFDYVVKAKKAKEGQKQKPDRIIKKGDEVGGNTRGTCIVEFSQKHQQSMPIIRHVLRDDLKDEFS